MNTKNNESAMREMHLLGAAKELADLMYEWNVIDEYDLCIENSQTGTPYHHVTSALGKVLALLGIKNPDRKMDFYEMVTTGMPPVEVIARIREFDASSEGAES